MTVVRGGWLLTWVRWLLGFDYAVNGCNWFHKIITAYPSQSDFRHFLPPPDIVGALIENGVLFPAAKAVELLTGIALLADLLVPLALVLAMSVTVPVFVVDVLHAHPHLRALLMGTGALTMNLFLLSAYLAHYRPLFVIRGAASLDPLQVTQPQQPDFAARLAAILRPCMLPWAVICAVMGTAMAVWLLVMIGEYLVDPLPISAVHPLLPRP